jgi:hypothetical protein
MATKKAPATPTEKVSRKNNHKTDHSRSACYRLPLGMYDAVASHAEANGISSAKQALRWLIAGAKKDGLEISDATREFAGL